MAERKLQSDEPVLEEGAEQEAPAAPTKKVPATDKTWAKPGPIGDLSIGAIKLVKWDGEKASLAPAVYGPAKNGKPAKFLKPGAPQHFLRSAGHRRYELIAVCRARGGTRRSLVALLRDEPKFPAAQALIKKLKKAGFLQ
jgi:hypothetical protein